MERPVVRTEGGQQGGGGGVADVDEVHAALAGDREHGAVGGHVDAVQLGAVAAAQGEGGDGAGLLAAEQAEHAV